MIFPDFGWETKKSEESSHCKNHIFHVFPKNPWYLQGMVCLGLAQAGSPDFGWEFQKKSFVFTGTGVFGPFPQISSVEDQINK